MNDSDPDHRIAFNECSEFILAEVACTCRTLRQNEVAQISSAVVYTDFYFVRNICPNSRNTALGSRTARERYSRLLYQSGGCPSKVRG